MKIVLKKVSELKQYKKNAKLHPEWQVKQIADSINKFGFNDPIAIDEKGVIIEGHGRFLACKMLGMEEVPTICLDHMTEQEKKAYILAHNKINMSTDFDIDILKSELEDITEINMDDFGFEFDFVEEDNVDKLANRYELEDESKGALNQKFIIPPLSVIESTKKEWLDIKNKWKQLFDSKVGRKDGLINESYGTSEFDGAICEVFYKWFNSDKTAKILDPFSGGCVRGAVAGLLGFKYVGFDIRPEQIQANKKIVDDFKLKNVEYINADSNTMDEHDIGEFDMVFSCPPYADLEVYSDLEGDISNKEYGEFIKLYSSIIKKSCQKLKSDSFAIFTVGDVRDEKGFYRDFIGDTIKAFESAEVKLYNRIIYKEPYGTAPVRCVRSFNSSRKITKVNQDILVFYKGDPKNIKNKYGEFLNETDFDFISE